MKILGCEIPTSRIWVTQVRKKQRVKDGYLVKVSLAAAKQKAISEKWGREDIPT